MQKLIPRGKVSPYFFRLFLIINFFHSSAYTSPRIKSILTYRKLSGTNEIKPSGSHIVTVEQITDDNNAKLMESFSQSKVFPP